jgi:TonB family protein
MKTLLLLAFSLFSPPLFSQTLSKDCFTARGILTDDETASEYCIIGKKVLRVDDYMAGMVKDTVESYVDTVKAYYSQTGKIKFIKIYNIYGREEGGYVAFYPNGKTKERGTYTNGVPTGLVTTFFSNGKSKSTIQLLPVQNQIAYSAELNFKIMSYRDSSGTQLVKSGNGYCNCFLRSGRREVGKVVDGARDSVWSEYSGDVLVLRETYARGELMEGVRYYKEKKYAYTVIAESPAYVGGYGAMMEIIRKNMRYPVAARRAGIDGIVELSFVVKTDGTIADIWVKKGISKECDEEAVRVASLLTEWTPGKLRGKPENVRFNLPIKFKLN